MNDDRRKIFKTLSLISQLGFTVLTAIFLCTALGLYLDKKFGTQIFTIIFIILGVFGGARGAFVLAKNSVTPSKEEEEDRNVSLRK